MHSIKNINISAKLEYNRSLADLTTFNVGGPADILAWPANSTEIVELISWAEGNSVPWMILGGGANMLVSDKGIRGLVIATGHLNSIRKEGKSVVASSGAPISDVSAFAADNNLAGLDFIYSMPGSTGGAVWMNARCYGGEISEILEWVDYIDIHSDESGRSRAVSRRLFPGDGDFAYKISPFQKKQCVILESSYTLKDGDSRDLWKIMREYEADRRSKGHFTEPCAGSVFKNNRAFGAPSGKIIDSLNLRGTEIGGARISDLHANIIVNHRDARAEDISALIDLVHARVLDELGYNLEPEVLRVGDWS